ncbi:hypothetical protein HS088_TW22G00048 [Tripterygium wilfordii]|uniref:Pectinesterase inhibitor domain-containing protein n=2 Tax=Tripterygium wilfordii TaxID=458696 RepID=A0A7J7BWX4_TRIWF|nr:hypothetical protein HS088_TW22G00048 [Tripterygium wilfordii]
MSTEHKKSFLLFLLITLSSFSIDAICIPRNSTSAPSPTPIPSSSPVESPQPFLDATSPFKIPHVSSLVPHVSGLLPSLSVTVGAGVQKICDSTSYPVECVDSLLPHISGEASLDVISAVKFQMEAFSKAIEQAIANATNLKDPSTEKMIANTIDACIESYTDSQDCLKKALEAIAAHDIGTLNSELSAALTGIVTCDDGFEELQVPGLKSPVAEIDQKLQKLASNCLAIGKLLQW